MSKIVLKRITNPLIGLMVLCLFATIISEIPIRVALISVFVFSIQALVGGLIFSWLVNNDHPTWQEFCGIGLALGSLLTVGFDQIFKQTLFQNFAWLFPTLIVMFIPNKKTILKNISTINREHLNTDLLVIAAMGFLIVATDWFWALPVVGVLIALIIWFEYVRFRFYAAISLIFSVPIAIFAFFTRPAGWWMEDSDLALNEAITQTLKVWGFTENINGVGTPIHYHWLVYGWSALVEHISGSPNWIVNSRVIPLIIGIAIALLIWSILSRLALSRQTILLSLLLIGLYDTVPTWGRGFAVGFTPSPSQMYGLLFLLTFVYLVITFETTESKKSSLIFLLVGFGAMGAKVPHGSILAATSGLIIVTSIFKSRRVFSKTTINYFAAILGAILGFALVIGGLSGSSRGMILDQVAFVNGITGDFRPYPIHVRWLAAIFFIFGFYGIHIVGLLKISTLKQHFNSEFKTLIFGVAIAGLAGAIFLSGEFAVELFFIQASSSILLLFLVPLVISLYNKQYISLKILFSVTALGILSAIVSVFIPNLENGSNLAIGLRLIPSLVGLIPVLAALVGSLVILKKIPKVTAAVNLALCGLLAMSVSFFAVNFVQNVSSEYPEFRRNFASRIGSDRPDLLSASKWISNNTDRSAIFATNDFCETTSTKCNAETDWVALMEFSMKCTQDEVLRSENCDAGGYKLLTALVDRRFLAGNYYVGISDGSAIKPWVAKRVIDSVNFAKFANESALQTLKESNVDWYLLRKELTSSQEWQKFGTIEYSNDSYAVIKLN